MAAAGVAGALKLGAMAGGSLLAKKLSGPTGPQQAAMTGTQNAAGAIGKAAPQLIGQGQQLTQQGAGYAGSAANYYQKLLGGRSSLREATAPDTATALDYYKGAAGKVNNTMRGGARDTALAELDRQKVGQLAMMPTIARGQAAQSLTGAAAPLLSAGTTKTGQGIYGGSAAAGASNALYNQASDLGEQQKKAGSTYGNFIYDLIKGIGGGKKLGKGGGVPSMPWTLPAGGGF